MKKRRFGLKKYKKKIVDDLLYRKWIAKYPEYSHISCDQFYKEVKKLLNRYVDMILSSPHGVKLPYFMGEIAVKYINKKAINVKSSLEAGKPVNHLNFQTSRKTAKIVWNIKSAKRFNKNLMFLAFEGHSTFKTKANKKIIESPRMFKNSDVK